MAKPWYIRLLLVSVGLALLGSLYPTTKHLDHEWYSHRQATTSLWLCNDTLKKLGLSLDSLTTSNREVSTTMVIGHSRLARWRCLTFHDSIIELEARR
jgi:hypothetical protein